MARSDEPILLEHCANEPVARVGRKALLLGWAQTEGMLTAGGLVLPADCFWSAMQFAKVSNQVRYLQENALRLDPQHTRRLAGAIRAALDAAGLEEFAYVSARSIYDRLNAPKLVCRSSAAMEDGATAAFPGVFVSSLDIASLGRLTTAIVDCWKSVFAVVAIDYLLRMRAEPVDFSLAVLIQPQIEASWYGLYVSADPVSRVGSHRVELTDVAPDALVSGKAASLYAQYQDEAWVGAERAPGLHDSLETIRHWSSELVQHLQSEIDIEFAIGRTGAPVLLQCRPMTGKVPVRPEVGVSSRNSHIVGRPCAAGIVIGFAEDGSGSGVSASKRVAVIDRIGAASYELVFAYDAMVVEQDVSSLSHVAILCRELGVPLISGIIDARATLTGQWVMVDGASGSIEIVPQPILESRDSTLSLGSKPSLATLELLLRVFAEALPGRNIAAERDRIARTYVRMLGGQGLHLMEVSLSDVEYDQLDGIGADLFGPDFSSRSVLATWNRAPVQS